MQKEIIWKILIVLSAVGIFLAMYLLFEQFTHTAFQPCTISSTINCNAIISGNVAKTFGIPTPLIGLVGYLIILFSTLRKKRRLLVGMATFGILFCLWIGFQELFLLHVICPVCLLCQLDMIAVLVLALILQSNKDIFIRR